MTELNPVQQRYTIDGFAPRLDAALAAAGYAQSDRIPLPALAQVDQFHVGGVEAIADLAERLNPKSSDRVLDVGAGLGGPARYLADRYGCHVTGIDLTPTFVDIAARLSARTGLSGRTHFDQGDATRLPYADGSFDHAWTHHVAMNIADKAALYAAIHRVLKPGGRFAIYDPVQGPVAPIHFPVPWAPDPSISFLLSQAELSHTLRGAGFELLSVADVTADSLAWFAHTAAAPPNDDPLNFVRLVDPSLRQAVQTLGRNLKENRVRLVKIVAGKV